MLRPNQVFNPDCFSLDNLEVVFDCQQETGEDGPYAALGYWYAKDRYAGTTPLEGWEEYGKSIETLLSLRCLEHEGSYYFFIFNPPLEEN